MLTRQRSVTRGSHSSLSDGVRVVVGLGDYQGTLKGSVFEGAGAPGGHTGSALRGVAGTGVRKG